MSKGRNLKEIYLYNDVVRDMIDKLFKKDEIFELKTIRSCTQGEVVGEMVERALYTEDKK